MPDTLVDIPGVGQVAFPDSMSADQINAAAKKLYDQSQTATPTSSGGSDSPLAFVSGAVSQLNPLAGVRSVGNALLHPVDTAKAIGAAHEATFHKGVDAYKKGNYTEAARHFVDYLIPVVGPAIDASTDKMQQGQPYRGAGEVLGQELGLGLMARGAMVPKAPAPTPASAGPTAAALQFGQDAGIPLDAATATQNKAVRAAQYLADRSLGGSLVAKGAEARTAAALTKTGEGLAARVHPEVVTPEQAGTALQQGVTNQITDLATQAETHYQRAEAAAVQTGATVDIAATKKAVQPLYDRLKREAELVPLQGGKARTLVALDRLMHGPDQVPLMTAERATGDLGALAGTPDLPELRTPGQASAAQAFAKLRQQVDATAAKAGPDVLSSLQQGRAATKAKYAAADVLDQMRSEPVGAFKQATAPKDAAISQLRDLQRTAPQALPQVGRAVLEDMLSTATREGGFQHADKLYADWQRLGPQTKQLLFGDVTPDLEKFFLLSKKLAENPNPSGTGHTVALAAQSAQLGAEPVTGLLTQAGAAGFSALLHNSTFVQGLNRALSLELGKASAPVRQAAWQSVQALIPSGDALQAARGLSVPVVTSQPDPSTTPGEPGR